MNSAWLNYSIFLANFERAHKCGIKGIYSYIYASPLKTEPRELLSEFRASEIV